MAHDEAVSGMELKYILVSGGDGFLTRTFTDEQAPEVFEQIFGTEGDGIVPYLADFLNKKSEEWNVHYWNQHPESWSVQLEDGWVSVYVLDDTHVDLTLPAQPAPEPLSGSASDGEMTELFIGAVEQITGKRPENITHFGPSAASSDPVLKVQERDSKARIELMGNKEREMYRVINTDDWRVPALSAWHHSEPEAWADARRRLTPEAASRSSDEDMLMDAYPDARIWEHSSGDWQVAAGVDGHIKTYGHKTREAAIATVAKRIRAMRLSPAPALKAQEGETHCPLCSEPYEGSDWVPSDGHGVGKCIDEEYHRNKQLKTSVDLASLANKLAAALEELRNNIGTASLVRNPYGKQIRDRSDAVLAEAKKAGCQYNWHSPEAEVR